MDLYPLLLDAMLAPHMLVRSQSKLATPVLEETSAGWLVTAALPGLSATEVSVETSVDADGDAHLWLHALKTELRLPRNADAAHISASLVDGVLRVAVPKAAPVSVGVKVEATPLPEDLPEPRAQVALALPGLGAADVTVTITRDRALLLHVRGDSAAFGSVHEVLRLPERAVVEQARAAMVNGVFAFSVPIAAEATTPVTVLATPPAEPMEAADAAAADKANNNKDAAAAAPTKVLLLEAAVPGLAAADFSGEVRGRTLTLTASKPAALGGKRVRRSVLLPPYTQPGDVVVTCVHGLLRATAPRAVPPPRTAVAVSATTPATLAAASPATPPATRVAAPAVEAPAEATTTEAPMEDADAVPELVQAAQ